MIIRENHRELACPGWREHAGTSVGVQMGSAARSRALCSCKCPCKGAMPGTAGSAVAEEELPG